MMLRTNERFVSLVVVAIPIFLYLMHAIRFGVWIVDDAAITFAYARNFAYGYGLVSQPGALPVEGYSNFTWLALLYPFFLLNGFDPFITSKVISVLLVTVSFVVTFQILKPAPAGKWLACTALTCTALNTSFVVWTISGLENALFVCFVSLLLWGTIWIAFNGAIAARNGLGLGILVALISMTRPEGIAYVFAFPLILLPLRKISWKHKGLLLLAYSAAFASVYGLFIAFRLSYFGFPLPNTYYMKGGPQVQDLLNLLTLQPRVLTRAQNLARSVFGTLYTVLPLLLVLGSLYIVIAKRWARLVWAILVFLLCSLALYLLLPPDWMAEFRFATLFFMLVYVYAAFVIGMIMKRLPRPFYIAALVILSGLAIVGTFAHYSPRSEAFSRNPTLPVQRVKARFADRFNGYNRILGLENASVLLPDVGGMLYYSDLRVYDLAGLTDRAVAQYLGKDIYRPGFYQYVFEEIVPTFIHTQGFWTQLARLEDDPRFAELYVPICTYTDPWVERNYGNRRQSGDFIHRSIVEAHPDAITEFRALLDENCNLK
jgi:hypothetical protein